MCIVIHVVFHLLMDVVFMGMQPDGQSLRCLIDTSPQPRSRPRSPPPPPSPCRPPPPPVFPFSPLFSHSPSPLPHLFLGVKTVKSPPRHTEHLGAGERARERDEGVDGSNRDYQPVEGGREGKL